MIRTHMRIPLFILMIILLLAGCSLSGHDSPPLSHVAQQVFPPNIDDGLFYYPQTIAGALPPMFNQTNFSKALVKWAVVEVRPEKLDSQPVIFNIFEEKLVLDEVRRFTCQDYLDCPDGQLFWGGREVNNSDPKLPYDGSVSILDSKLVNFQTSLTKGGLRYSVYYDNESNQTILYAIDSAKFQIPTTK